MTFLPALLLAAMPALAAASASTAYLTPAFHKGVQFDNVFSRTIAYRAAGFDENVRRVSGGDETSCFNGKCTRTPTPADRSGTGASAARCVRTTPSRAHAR